MKIAFTTKGTTWDAAMDPRFGRTDFFLIYDVDGDDLIEFDNRAIAAEAHGAGPQTAQKLFEFQPDILITGNGPGGNAARVLEQSAVKVFIGAGDMTVREAYQAYQTGQLTEI